MDSPFSKEFLNETKTALEEIKLRLERQLKEIVGNDIGKGNAFPNFGDGEDESAEEVATYDANLQLSDSMQSEMRDVNESLHRIEVGTYGICKYCQKPIDEHRLRARPTSSSCVACKKALTQEI